MNVNNKLKCVLDCISDAYFIVDKSWRITNVNNQAKQAFNGLQLQDKSLKDLFRIEPSDENLGSSFDVKDLLLNRDFELKICSLEDDQILIVAKNKSFFGVDSRFEDALMATETGVWEWNIQSGEINWSQSIYAIHGLKVGEVERNFQEVKNFVYEEDQDYVNSAISDAIEGKKDYEAEFRIVWPDKSLHWVAGRGRVIRDESGKAVSMIGTVRNIDKRKNTEKLLGLNKNRFQAVFNSSLIGIFTSTFDGRMLKANKTFLDMMGFTFEDMENGKIRWDEMTPPEWLPADEKGIEEIKQKGYCTPYEKEYIKPNGERITIILGAEIVDYETGECLCFVLDITQRRKAEIALKASEEKYRQLIELSPDAVFIHENGIITFANQATLSIFGADNMGELLGKNAYELIHPESLPIVQERIELLKKEGKNVPYVQEKWLKVNGQVFDAEVSASIISAKPCFSAQVVVRDITERKRIEANLRESEQRFRIMADQAPVLIWLSDTSAKCTFFNKPWLEFTSRSMEQEIGDGWAEGVHPDDYELCLKTYLEAFNKREPFTMDYRLRRKDGEYRWMLDSGTPVLSPDGEFKGYIGSCTDITDRKLAETTILEQNEILTDFFDNAPVGIHWIDKNGYIIRVNRSQLKMLGYTQEEYVGQHVKDFMDSTFDPENMEKLRRGETLKNIEVTLKAKDGTPRHVLFSSNALFKDGKFVYARSFIRDITDRKKAEEELKVLYAELEDRVEQRTLELSKANKTLKYAITERKRIEDEVRREKEFSEQVIKISLDGVIAFDMECNYTVWNPGMEAITGMPASEVVGKYAFDLFPFLRENNEAFYMFEAMQGRSQIAEDRPFYIPQTGKRGYFEGYYSPLKNDKGEIIGGLAVIRNITDRKSFELELKSNEEKLRLFVEHTPAGVAMFDKDMRYLVASKQWIRDFGLLGKDIIGKCHYDVFGYLADSWKEINNRGLNGETLFSEEDRFVFEDGTEAWLSWRLEPWRNLNGEIGGVIIFTQFVTERKRAQEALKSMHIELEARVHERTKELEQTNELLKKEVSFRQTISSRLEDETKTLEKLNEIGKIISAELNLETVIQTITSAATDLSGAEFGIFLPSFSEELNKSFFISERYNLEPKQYASLQQIKDLLSGVLARHFILRIDVVNSFTSENNEIKSLINFLKKTFQMSSYMAVPVNSRSGRFLGSLFFAHNESAAFSEREEKIVAGLAAQAAVAIDNAKLFEIAQAERARAEENEQYYRFLTQSIPQIVWTADRDGKTDFFNHKLSEYTGLNLEQIRNGGLHSIIHPDDLERSGKRWLECVSSGELYEDEFRFKRISDSTYRWQLGRAVPLRDQNGNIIKWFGTTTDIDDQKRVEERIRESEAKFRRLVESNIVGVFFTDESRRITEANDAFLHCIGYTRQDLQEGKLNWFHLTPPEYHAADEEKAKILLSEGVLAPYEKEYIKKDGSRVPIFLGAALTEGPEKVIVAFVLDITERKELEKRKDEFISMASHELKTPVTSTKVFTQMLLKMFEERDGNKEPLVFLTKMDEQIDKLSKLIADLLNISKMQSGRLEFYKQWFEMDELIQEVVETCQLSSKKHKVTFVNKSKASIYADKERIEQVLVNLLTNAIKYSPNADEIVVEAKIINEEVQVSVQDFGIGISAEHQNKIFNRFYRVFEGSEKTFPGLGIGLYISAEIIKFHGGNIWVNSSKGKGTTLTFSLPLKVGIIKPLGELLSKN